MRLILFFLLIAIAVTLFAGFSFPSKSASPPLDYDRVIAWEDIYGDDFDQEYDNTHESYNTNISVVEGAPADRDIVSKIKSGDIRGRWVWAKVTAYTPGPESCGPYADGFTSIMVNIQTDNPNKVYGIAVNPRAIPYRTPIYVPGYWESLQSNINLRPTNMTIADDTGSAMRNFRPHWRTINGNRVYIEVHLDVRYRLVSTCMNWGVRYMRVFIYN